LFIDKIAWILLRDGQVLSTRNKGKTLFYLPGGKREPGESDLQTLIREVREELSVSIEPGTVRHLGTFQAQADGYPPGTPVKMACYTAAYEGQLSVASEIAEMTWLGYGDRERVSETDKLVFDHLHDLGELR
jgi:8-oxo-dGTP diphosphatase